MCVVMGVGWGEGGRGLRRYITIYFVNIGVLGRLPLFRTAGVCEANEAR